MTKKVLLVQRENLHFSQSQLQQGNFHLPKLNLKRFEKISLSKLKDLTPF